MNEVALNWTEKQMRLMQSTEKIWFSFKYHTEIRWLQSVFGSLMYWDNNDGNFMSNHTMKMNILGILDR